MKPLNQHGLIILVVLGVIILSAAAIRESLAEEIKRWPDQSDTNRWYEFIRFAALAVLIAIFVTLAKLATDECLNRLANS